MEEKLQSIKRRYLELEQMLGAIDAMADQDAWRANVKEHAELSELVEKYDELVRVREQIADCHEMIASGGETELVELARRGAADLQAEMPDDLAELLAGVAHGDARTLLNLVEYVAALPSDLREIEHIKAALPEVLVRHDKDGDNHYELASALIKSIRGSDVDAALYYLACLLEGAEDPRFICRRLILSASEDVGLADPNALPLAVACQQAVEFVGMPEGFIPLAETVTYLALARKSNASYAAYLNAQREIKLNGPHPVPLHLRNPSTQMHKEWGYGKEYKYPHNYPDSWIQQAYLPQELEGRRFYQPRDNGEEPRLTQWWRKLHKIKKTED